MKYIFLCLSLIMLTNTFASHITISTYISSSVKEGKATIECKITNNGDEAAYKMRIDAIFENKMISSDIIDKIKPEGSIKKTLSADIDYDFTQIIVPLLIHYHDANGYSFSTISYAELKKNSQVASTVFGKIETATIAQNGKINFYLKSLNGKPREVSVKLAMPKEISVKPLTQKIHLPATGEVTGSFMLHNFSAIANSQYSLLMIISENNDKRLLENAFIGRVNITKSKKISDFFSLNLMIPLLTLLILAFIIYQVITRRKSKK